VTRSQDSPADRTPSPPTEAGSGWVDLSNEGPVERSVAVVIRHPDDRTSVERVHLAAGSAARVGLPASDGHLTVGCYSDDGRGGVSTYHPGTSRTVGVTLREGSILLESG
jgi:hypothetical protein